MKSLLNELCCSVTPDCYKLGQLWNFTMNLKITKTYTQTEPNEHVPHNPKLIYFILLINFRIVD